MCCIEKAKHVWELKWQIKNLKDNNVLIYENSESSTIVLRSEENGVFRTPLGIISKLIVTSASIRKGSFHTERVADRKPRPARLQLRYSSIHMQLVRQLQCTI
mmetsp:Transcript_13535/g.38082  ORF Transcript_13535/g.38082 Transcript_13535/m.38082 type:complete len:103 (+) Transcript_13535:336-644(+)